LDRLDGPRATYTIPLAARLKGVLDVEALTAAFGDVVAAARTFAWTREPFDRLIVANAMADGVRLPTADEHILQHFRDAVW